MTGALAGLKPAAIAADTSAGAAIGVVFPGDPSAPATWSGTPGGVIAGMRAIGARPAPVNAMPPERVHRLLRDAVAITELRRSRRGGIRPTLRLSRAAARNTPAMARLYTRSARAAVIAAGAVDGLVQIGTGYSLPSGRPIATFEDMTIRQAVECGYPEWRALTTRQLTRRLDLQRRAYEAAAVCCLTTWWAAQSVIDDYDVPPEKVRVVGVGRNHAVDPPADRDWSIPRFLFVGWEWERKNGPAVVRAFARLRERIGEARLDIVGKHERIDAPGVTDHGILRLDRPEERDRLEPLFRRATCFVMPSRCEPSALAYVEAMHAGLPCIGTTVGGAGNLIGDGGCVVDPSSEASLLEAMSMFADPGRAAAVGPAARRRSRLFTWPLVAGRLMRALDVPVAGETGHDEFVDRTSSPVISAA